MPRRENERDDGTHGRASGVATRAPRPFFSLALHSAGATYGRAATHHITRHDTNTGGHEARGSRILAVRRKDTCCTALWVAVSGLCDSLSSVRICLSPSSCGCHAIFIVFFNSTTVTRSLPSLTSQINGSFLQRSLSLFLSPPSPPVDRAPRPLRPSARTVVARGGATPFHRARPRREGRLPCFRFVIRSEKLDETGSRSGSRN